MSTVGLVVDHRATTRYAPATPMPRSQLTVEFTWEPNWERLARALNVPREKLRVTQAGADVERLWVETPLNDAWTSAARLAVQNGQIIVAEVRVFPNEPGRKRPD